MIAGAIVVCAGVAAALAPAALAGASYSSTIADAQSRAVALLEASGAPSMSVALMSGDQVVWAQGFGYADVAGKAAPTAETMFGVGSVSKMVATVAVMRLVDQGKVSLDAPVTRYVSSFRMASPAYSKITVRMLLDHASGVPGSTHGDLMTPPDYYPGYQLEVLQALAVSRLKADPGLFSVYANDGFTLAELVIQSVSGKSYADFVRDEVFGPLDMQHSSFADVPFADGTFARSYSDGQARPREAMNMLGSGGAYSTPTDLGHLAAALVNGGLYGDRRFLSLAAVQAMGADQTIGQFNPFPTDVVRYGLGWDTVTQPGLKQVGMTAWYKGGDTDAYHAAFLVIPQERLAVCVAGVAPLSSSRLEVYAERVALDALVETGRLTALPDPLVEDTTRVKAPQARLNAMEGYWGSSSAVMKITASSVDKQALDIYQLVDGTWVKSHQTLTLRADGYFRAGDPSGFRCKTIVAGEKQYLVASFPSGSGTYREEMLYAQRLKSIPPVSAAWRARVGHAWLAVNEIPASVMWDMPGGPVLAVSDIPGLPGYLTVATGVYTMQPLRPLSDSRAGFFLQIPGVSSRDMVDAIVLRHSGEDWMRFANTIYRPLATIPALTSGTNAVAFGSEGYAEWRVVPAGATVDIASATAWCLYDPSLTPADRGESFPASTTAPIGGGYLLLFGTAGSSSDVTVSVPVGTVHAAPDPRLADSALPAPAEPLSVEHLLAR